MALSAKEVLAGAAVWGIPAMLELLAPWQDALTGLRLISEYYQPHANIFASAVGALGAMMAYALLNDQSRPKQRRWALIAAIAFGVCLVICLVLKFSLGVSFFPDPALQLPIDVVNWLSYVGLFGTSGLLIMALLMAGAARPPRSPAAKKPTER